MGLTVVLVGVLLSLLLGGHGGEYGVFMFAHHLGGSGKVPQRLAARRMWSVADLARP